MTSPRFLVHQTSKVEKCRTGTAQEFIYPKDVLNIELLGRASTAGIKTGFKPVLIGLYSDVSIVDCT